VFSDKLRGAAEAYLAVASQNNRIELERDTQNDGILTASPYPVNKTQSPRQAVLTSIDASQKPQPKAAARFGAGVAHGYTAPHKPKQRLIRMSDYQP